MFFDKCFFPIFIYFILVINYISNNKFSSIQIVEYTKVLLKASVIFLRGNIRGIAGRLAVYLINKNHQVYQRLHCKRFGYDVI